MSELANIDVLILCGGLGTRLREEIGESQKVMAEIDGKPFLDIHLTYLKAQGFKHVVLCTGYKSDEVKKYYTKNTHGLDISFSVEKEPLGTGGGVMNAKKHVKSNDFFILNGDSFCPIDYMDMYKFHLMNNSNLTIAVNELKEKTDFGSMIVEDNGVIKLFKEKTQLSAANRVNAGVYCSKRVIFATMPETQKFSLEKDLFPLFVGHKFFGYEVKDKFYDIGTPERYKIAVESLKE